MSYKSKFKYNEAYSNEDIAEALSIITGSGIIPSTPNEILSKYSSGGVTYADERLKVSLSGTAVTVGCGAAIWSDGSYIIVYEPETFTISLSETYYIYLMHNMAGDISVKCESALPQANYMLLSTVTNGTVTDNRAYATSKITSYGKSSLHELTLASSSYGTAAYTLPNYNFSLLIFMYKATKKPDIRAAVYNAETASFLDDCNMLHDTGSSSSFRSVSSVSITDNVANVCFNNMTANEIKSVAVYCI